MDSDIEHWLIEVHMQQVFGPVCALWPVNSGENTGTKAKTGGLCNHNHARAISTDSETLLNH